MNPDLPRRAVTVNYRGGNGDLVLRGENGSMKSWGSLLRHWRLLRGLSQQELALAAEISPRHVSFLETGRARPSAEMVGLLCTALRVPPRERNALLQAAGFAPQHRAVDLGEPSMAETRLALQLILKRNEPYGAVVIDRRWDILMANESFARFLAAVDHPVAAYEVTAAPRRNWLRVLFAPGKVRAVIANWPEVAAAVRARVAREDPELAAELGEPLPPPPADTLLIPVRMRLGEHELRLISTVSSLGTALDVALQELKIDAFHPLAEG
jgi:transcriptional regulator with XRE-family HTH domain